MSLAKSKPGAAAMGESIDIGLLDAFECTPATLSAEVTAARDRRRPHVFTTTGRLTVPAGVDAQRACRGLVSVRVKAGRSAISNRRRRVRDDCRFRSRVAFGNLRRFAGRRTLKFTVRFLGNEAVRPIATPPQFVRVRDGDGDGAADGPRRFAAPQRTA